AAVRQRLAARDDWRRSLLLAAMGFVTVSLVPFLKYPANPPSVGSPDTLGRRTALYLLVLAWSVVTAIATWRLWRWLSAHRWTDASRHTATAAFGLAMIAFAYAVFRGSPAAVPLPPHFLWRF